MKIPGHIDVRRDGQYCLHCFAESITRVVCDDKTYYACSQCGQTLEKSLVIDRSIRWHVDVDGNYWHESAGVVVMCDSKILCLMRRYFPFAYAIPAGHVDVGEAPDQAAERELREETGIVIKNLELVATFDLPGDSCRRGSDHHQWNLYRTQLDSLPPLHVSDEASSADWLSIPEILALNNATYPLRWILENFSDKILAQSETDDLTIA